VRALVEAGERDERIVLLTGDLGYMALEPFADRFPDRFFNVGVAEQNMVGVATGLAEAGFIPYVYSIATFASLRPYEFIRNGPVLHRLPVRIVGVGGGVEYGSNGISHYALEDLAVMRVQPALTVLAPADHRQASTLVAQTVGLPGPIYYRLGKDDVSLVPGLDGRFELGRAELVRQGTDCLMITIGAITVEAVAAADLLEAEGVSCAVLVVSSLRPAPETDIADALLACSTVMTVEAHYTTGGLGSLVAEIATDRGISCRLRRCGFDDQPDTISGSQGYMQDAAGLSAAALARTALQLVAGSNPQGVSPILPA
jgi:transketolase